MAWMTGRRGSARDRALEVVAGAQVSQASCFRVYRCESLSIGIKTGNTGDLDQPFIYISVCFIFIDNRYNNRHYKRHYDRFYGPNDAARQRDEPQ